MKANQQNGPESHNNEEQQKKKRKQKTPAPKRILVSLNRFLFYFIADFCSCCVQCTHCILKMLAVQRSPYTEIRFERMASK